MVWLVGKCGCHDRSFSGILGPRLFLSPDNIYECIGLPVGCHKPCLLYNVYILPPTRSNVLSVSGRLGGMASVIMMDVQFKHFGTFAAAWQGIRALLC